MHRHLPHSSEFGFRLFRCAVPVGSLSVAQSVTLTNNSAYPLTIAGPAVTFSDPGFQIANDGNDNCSNKQLAVLGTCTLNVVFAPVFSDAPNTINGPTSSVNATMIVAATENAALPIPPDNTLTTQNIQVTAQALVSGTAAPLPSDEQGASWTQAFMRFRQIMALRRQRRTHLKTSILRT